MKILYTIAAFLISMNCFSQDVYLNNWQANYNILNPALTGISVSPHINLTYRNQFFNNVGDGFASYKFSYDSRITAKSNFAGISIIRDEDKTTTLTNDIISAQYAKQLTVNENFKIRLGGQFSYMIRSINWGVLRNGDKILVRNDVVLTGNLKFPENQVETRKKPDFSFGAAVVYKNTLVGYSIHHVLTPVIDFQGNPETMLPRLHTFHFTTFIPVNENTTIAPSIIYHQQETYKMFMPSVIVNKGNASAGLIFKSRDVSGNSLAVVAGYSTEKLKFGYSFGRSLDSGALATNTHEITLSFYPVIFGGDNESLATNFRRMAF